MNKNLLLIILLISKSLVGFSVNRQDSLALVAIYNSCDGENWVTNTNWITGRVSDWHGVTVLNGRVKQLDLTNNALAGEIPPEIGNLTHLTYLNLTGNSLTGEIPPEIGNLTNLVYLCLYFNSLTGSIPAEIGNLSNLVGLYLFYNSLTGEIPAEIGKLKNLEVLNLSSNALMGKIPLEICGLKNLIRLDLSSNFLTDGIPFEIENLVNLTRLDLSSNSLTGEIPLKIGNLKNLLVLDLAENSLTGRVPSLLDLNNLQYLIVNNNYFTFTDIAASKVDTEQTSISYNFQGKLSVPTFTTTAGSIVLTVPEGHPKNEYKWFRDSEEIRGEVEKQLLIPANSMEAYYCEITNNLYPELTLTTEPLILNNLQPTVTLTSAGSNPGSSSITVQIAFNKAVTGFEAEDIICKNGKVSDFIAISDTEYAVNITPVEGGIATLDIAANAAKDLAGNGNRSAAQWSIENSDVQNLAAAVSIDAVSAGENFKIASNSFSGSAQLAIYNLNGKSVYTKEINFPCAENIDVSHFDLGMYILKLSAETEVITSKFLIAR